MRPVVLTLPIECSTISQSISRVSQSGIEAQLLLPNLSRNEPQCYPALQYRNSLSRDRSTLNSAYLVVIFSAMGEESRSQTPSRWLSINGQPLSLDAVSTVHGNRPQPSTVPALTLPGQCTSIGSYEKLNKLGEGSTPP